MAKHYSKNVPFFSRETVRRVLAAAGVITFLSGVGYGVVKLTSMDAEKESSERVEPGTMPTPKIGDMDISYLPDGDESDYPINELDVNYLLDSIESNYQIYGPDGKLNTTGLVFEYLRNKTNDNNLSNHDRLVLLNNMLSSDEMIIDLYNYIMSNKSGAIEIPVDNIQINTSNLTNITSDQEMMGYIYKYSEMYGVPEDIIIGILAYSQGENYDNTGHFNMSSYWNEFGTTRYVRNFVTGNDDKVNNYKNPVSKEDRVKYVCMVVANSLKESNHDLGASLYFYYLGPDIMRGLDQNNMQNEDAVRFRNGVILYAMAHEKDGMITLDFTYPSSINNSSELTATFVSSDYGKDLINTVMAINSAIRVNTQDFSNAKTR